MAFMHTFGIRINCKFLAMPLINVDFCLELVHLTFMLRNLLFIFSTIKCELIKQLYNINLRRLPSQHRKVFVMRIYPKIRNQAPHMVKPVNSFWHYDAMLHTFQMPLILKKCKPAQEQCEQVN